MAITVDINGVVVENALLDIARSNQRLVQLAEAKAYFGQIEPSPRHLNMGLDAGAFIESELEKLDKKTHGPLIKMMHEILNFRDDFKESEHPRGHEGNPGQFATKGSGGTVKKATVAKTPSSAAKAPPSSGGHAQGSASAHLQPAHVDREQWPAHIKKMKVPPAWKNIQISHDPNAALQVLGHDVKGRKQYVYSEKHATEQAEAKFGRIKELEQKFEQIHNQNSKNLKSDVKQTREHAEAMSLIMELGIRPGSDEDTKAAEKAYGATTLQGKHVVTSGGKTRLVFTGKKGVGLDLPVTNPQIAKLLQDRKKEAGNSGKLFSSITAASLLDYVHKFDGGSFKTKDFRTYVGTKAAQKDVAATPAPTNEAEYKKAVKKVATTVAAKLGNTPAVALQSYISPVVFSEWRNGIK